MGLVQLSGPNFPTESSIGTYGCLGYFVNQHNLAPTTCHRFARLITYYTAYYNAIWGIKGAKLAQNATSYVSDGRAEQRMRGLYRPGPQRGLTRWKYLGMKTWVSSFDYCQFDR